MSAVAAIRETRLTVDPGGEVSTEITVLNTGGIVDQFTLEVVGPAESWVTLEPRVLSLFPDAQQVAIARFHPPRSYAVPPGPVPFAVRIIPSNDPAGSVAEEGTIEVGRFEDVAAEMVPSVVEGRIGAHVNVAVDSRGNTPMRVRLLTSDPAAALRITPRPDFLDLMPNQASFSTVKLRPRFRHLRGAAKQNRFKVIVDHEGTALATLDGTMVQKPLLPRFALAAIIAALALAVWLFVFRPVIRNTASSAANQVLSSQQARTNQAAAAAQAASSKAAAVASKQASTAKSVNSLAKKLNALAHKKPAATTTTTTTTTLPPPKFVTVSFNKSLENNVAPGSNAQVSWTVPASSSFALTDLVVDSLGPGTGGDVRVELTQSGQTTQTLIEVNLAQLSNVAFQDARFQTPISFAAGQAVVLNVTCLQNDGGGCDVGVLFSGQLTKPAPPPAKKPAG